MFRCFHLSSIHRQGLTAASSSLSALAILGLTLSLGILDGCHKQTTVEYRFTRVSRATVRDSDLILVSENAPRHKYKSSDSGDVLTFELSPLAAGKYHAFLVIPGRTSAYLGDVSITGNTQVIANPISGTELLKPTELHPSLILDAKHISDSEAALVMQNLLTQIPTSSWKPYSVQPGDSVFSVVNSQYRFPDAEYLSTAKTIGNSILEVNGVQELVAGSTIQLPPLPQRPVGNGEVLGLTQRVSPTTGSVTPQSLNINGPLFATTDRPLRDGATWYIRDPNNLTAHLYTERLTSRINSALPPSVSSSSRAQSAPTIEKKPLRHRIYVDYGTDRIEFLPLDVPNTRQSSNPLADPVLFPATVAIPGNLAPNADLYLLDFFPRGETCSHGSMVYSVALQTLEALHMSQSFQAHVHQVNLDFYSDIPASKQIVEEYAASFDQGTQAIIVREMNDLIKQGPHPSAGLSVPALFLSAIISHYSSLPNAIISTSVVTYTSGFQWLPDNYSIDSTTVFLAAVLDRPADARVEDSMWSHTDPIQSFLKSPQLGVVLVGGELGPGTVFGMSSSRAAVSCVGFASGWNHHQGCFADSDAIGTSFAVPYIASELLVAESVWHANQFAINAANAKRRLLLAGLIDPLFIDRFASAGVPQLDRMMVGDGFYLLRRDGTMEKVSVLRSTVEGVRSSGQSFLTSLARGALGASGLEFVDSSAFLFLDGDARWEKVTITSCDLAISGRPNLSLSQLTQDYKGVIVI